LKLTKKNRFQEGAGEREQGAEHAPARGPAHVLDVEGQVTFEGEQPVTVIVFGKTYAFEAGSALVRIEAVTYQLVRLDGRAQLVPASI
jgi:hypothetical protein